MENSGLCLTQFLPETAEMTKMADKTGCVFEKNI